MAKIDDPFEQARSQWLGGGEPFANALTQEVFKKGFPILGRVFAFWKSAEQKQVLIEFNNWVVDFLKLLDRRIDDLPEELLPVFNRIAALSVERILWGASNKKAKRFAAVVASTVAMATTEQQFEDAAFFVHALDELSEDDIKVLNHLFKYQGDLVKENHHVDYNRLTERTRIESVLRNVGDLKIQMDEFYARCSRLSGYGLALPVERNTKFDPSEYMFRITLIGKRLIEILAAAEK
jgi:hypothetical protein